METPPDHAAAAPDQNQEQTSARMVASAELFQGKKVVIIRHEGAEYRLRITKAGKLILNK